jgi:WXG100 family type VII secretion target
MADIVVSSESLDRQSQAVVAAAADISHTLQAVTGQVQGLTADWRGASSDAFQNMWHEWQQGATQLLAAMDGIGRYLGQAARTYEDAEAAVGGGLKG